MGLDDAEIYMDLEDRFHIPFEPDQTYDGTVHAIIHYYQERFHVAYFHELQKKIMNYPFSSDESICRSEYNVFAECLGWPKASWFSPRNNPGSKKAILEIFDRNVSKIDFSICVSQEVKRIIKERLHYPGIILESHHLYKDLGAG